MQTPSLSDCQDAFASGIFAGEDKVLDWIAAPATRFDIYRASVVANLRNALRAVYPVVLRLTGEQFFDQKASRYVREHPSHSGDLHRYGASFADFLAHIPEAQALAYLPDVARLEWLWHEAFHAADATNLDLAALARVEPTDYERLRFQLQPACRLLNSPYPVFRIWEANQVPHEVVEEVNLQAGPESLIVHRSGYEVLIARLSAGEYALALGLQQGMALGAAMAHAVAVDPQADAAAALRSLATSGVLAGVELI